MRRPALTKKMANKLRGLAGYIEAEADMLTDGSTDQIEQQAELRAAVDWVRDLCAWHSAKEKSKATTRK